MVDGLRERSLSDRLVALALVDLAATGETPAHTGQVSRTSNDVADELEADVLGKISEAEVNRALNRLEADGFVEAVEGDDTSAVGKGRPRFGLADDPADVVTALADDDQVGVIATRVGDTV